MRFPSLTFTILSSLVASAVAFPSMATLEKRGIKSRAQFDEAMVQAQRIARMVEESHKMEKRDSQPTITPDPNDKDHVFQEPGPTDQRGPCPGMNTLANHGYLPRNGIVTLADLIDGQKKLYNIDYDLGAVLALIATSLDGDLLTTKLSLGGKDSRTMITKLQGLISDEPGLVGHNRFEADTSLTRYDYYLNDGDNYSFQGDLFKRMEDAADSISNGRHDINSLGKYRYDRYLESRANNPKFYFNVKALLLWGAASFVYEAFGNATEPGGSSSASKEVVRSFFGAVEDSSAKGGFRYQAERVPSNWYRRSDPYTLIGVARQIGGMYSLYPVSFGANGEGPDHLFVPFPANMHGDGLHIPENASELDGYCCALFQLIFDNMPSMVATPFEILQNQLDYMLGAAVPAFKNSCNCGNPNLYSTKTGNNTSVQQNPNPLASLLPKGDAARSAGAQAISDALTSAVSS